MYIQATSTPKYMQQQLQINTVLLVAYITAMKLVAINKLLVERNIKYTQK